MFGAELDRRRIWEQVRPAIEISDDIQYVAVVGSWANPEKTPTADSDIDIHVRVDEGSYPSIDVSIASGLEIEVVEQNGESFGWFPVHFMSNAPSEVILSFEGYDSMVPLYERSR